MLNLDEICRKEFEDFDPASAWGVGEYAKKGFVFHRRLVCWNCDQPMLRNLMYQTPGGAWHHMVRYGDRYAVCVNCGYIRTPPVYHD